MIETPINNTWKACQGGLQGNRTSIHLCDLLDRRTPINVSYVFYEGMGQTHRLSFKKKRRVVFELFLPEHRITKGVRPRFLLTDAVDRV